MQLAAGALQNRTTYEEPVQTDGSKMRAHAHVIKENRSARFGLPCANCKAYYASDLPSCPICKCAERVPARKASRGVLRRSFINLGPTPACSQRRQLAVHGDKDAKRFLLESKLLLCADTDEINAGASLS